MENKIVGLVDKVIKNKKEGHDTKNEEWEIDKIVYELYDLTKNEIDIIEGKDLI